MTIESVSKLANCLKFNPSKEHDGTRTFFLNTVLLRDYQRGGHSSSVKFYSTGPLIQLLSLFLVPGSAEQPADTGIGEQSTHETVWRCGPQRS